MNRTALLLFLATAAGCASLFGQATEGSRPSPKIGSYWQYVPITASGFGVIRSLALRAEF